MSRIHAPPAASGRDRRVKGGALQLNSAAHVNAQALAGSQQAVAHGLRASGDGVEPSLDLTGHKPQRVKKRLRPRRAVASQHGFSGCGVVVAAAIKADVRQVAASVARGQNGQAAGHVALEHADGGARAARGYGGGKAGGPSTNDGNVVAGLRAGVHGFSLSGSGRVVRPGAVGHGWARVRVFGRGFFEESPTRRRWRPRRAQQRRHRRRRLPARARP